MHLPEEQYLTCNSTFRVLFLQTHRTHTPNSSQRPAAATENILKGRGINAAAHSLYEIFAAAVLPFGASPNTGIYLHAENSWITT